MPISLLSENEQAKRRKLNRENTKRFRERRKMDLAKTTPEGADEPTKMIVKLDFNRGKKSSSRKRISRGVAKAHKKIKKLQEENTKLQRKNWKLQKKMQRSSESRKTARKAEASEQERSPKTPRSKANATIRSAGMSPRTVPHVIRKQLIFAQAFSDEVRQAVEKGPQNSNTRRGLSASVVSGAGILKKYRCIRLLKKLTGISRGLLSKVRNKLSYPKRERLPEKSKGLTDAIVTFLERGDNSHVMPGKDDFVKYNGGKVQKYYLNDYIYNLHAKFRAENPNTKIGKTAFAKRRPKYIIPTSFSSRRTCLCQHHQNMSLKLRAIKSHGVKVTTSPDVFINNYEEGHTVQEVLNQLPARVQFNHWKRVEVDGKKKMKLLTVEMEKTQFGELFRKEVKKFREHARRVKIQYEQLKLLKENLPEDHAIVQMDFAENYTCQSLEEIQSAYWNASMVTLHPAVAYYHSEDSPLSHKSRVFVSDELGHNSATVYAFLKELIPNLKAMLPNLKHVHYYTDSPTSQYRNKTIFYLISRHKELFDVTASWNYFEAGHGKGPCDGVGGSVKRMADEAVRQQKASIQDAPDFFAWTQQQQSSSSVAFTFVSKEACSTAKSEIERFGNIVPVPGTMSVHAVAAISPGKIMARETSCHCQQCFTNGRFNPESPCSWKIHLLKECPEEEGIVPVAGDWVAAVYDDKWYVGKVLEVDLVEKDAQISFMHDARRQGGFLKWPTSPDDLWIDLKSVLAIIEAPSPCGRRQRQYKLNADTVSMVESLFTRHQADL